MVQRAVVDLIGMYNYDNSVLDLMQIPEALDRPTLIDNLLMETAEMELLYNNVGFLKQAIGSWSRKNITVWSELYDTTQYEYNPIWNKDGHILETETRDLAGSDHTTDNTDRVDNLQDKNTRNFEDKNTRNFEDKETRDLDDSNTHSVYGFNSDSAAHESKDEGEQNGTDTINHTGTDTYNHTGTDTYDHTGRQDVDRTFDKATTDTGTITHERTEQGNIGLTSTQQLIQEQRELVKINLMDIIINDFKQRFCLGVY